MECPYCGAYMDCTDIYGIGIPGRSDFQELGEIYQCPNHEYFEDLDEARVFLDNSDSILCPEGSNAKEIEEQMASGLVFESLEDVFCYSGMFNGFFYTRENDGELYEGYPC